jgi:Mg-chelatase subunit ChlD
MQNKTIYQFSAIVGQEKMKLATILKIINPKISGVLLRSDKEAVPLLVLLSEGRATVNLYGGDSIGEAKTVAREVASAGIQSLALDTEQGFLSFGLVKQISTAMGGKYLCLEELSAAPIVSAVRTKLYHDPTGITINN